MLSIKEYIYNFCNITKKSATTGSKIKMSTILSAIFVGYIFGYISISLINGLYFLNLFVASIKLASDENATNVIKKWITYSVIIILSNIINIITNIIRFGSFNLLGDFLNVMLYYNLYKSETMSDNINNFINQIYKINKTGIDTVQYESNKFIKIIVDSFDNEYIDKLNFEATNSKFNKKT